MTDAMAPLIEAYLDGSIDADSAERLATVLREDSAQGRQIREQIAFAGLIGQACDATDADAVQRAVSERIDAQGSASALVRAVQQSIGEHVVRQRWQRRVALAAILALLVLGGGILMQATRPELGRITASTAAASVIRDGVDRPATADFILQPGDVLVAPDAVALTYRHGVRLQVESGRGTVVDHAHFTLEDGQLTAEVPRQPEGTAFIITTPQAEVRVVGTRFSVTADANSSRIDLHEGEVILVRRHDGRSLTLHAGEYAVADATSVDLAARSQDQDGWQALFPDGLTGWHVQHGDWEHIDGIVRGRGTRSATNRRGRARLMSEAAILDCEVVCQLRAVEAHSVELQVGDYNWFFAMPPPAAWVDVHLRQRGAELTCTVDGVPLPCEPGDGQPMRPGPLSFYIGAGGLLEIRNARIRTP